MISPQKLAADGTESGHQKAFMQWIALYGSKRYPDMLMTYAIPNGSKLFGSGTARGQSEGAKMKAEGLRAGIPDVFTAVACYKPGGPEMADRYHGLYLELKKPGREREAEGARSDDQVKWHKKLISKGYAVATVYGWTAMADATAMYFSGFMQMPDGGDCLFVVGTGEPPW